MLQPVGDRSEDASKRESRAVVHVQLQHGLDARDYRARYAEGKEPDATPYGFHMAEEFGYTVTWSQDKDRGPFATLAAKALRRVLGFDPLHAWQNRHRAGAADVIWTMLEGDALGLAALMQLGLMPRRPIVTSIVWMVNNWPNYGPLRRRFLRWLTRRWSGVFVHAQSSVEPARKCLPFCDVDLLFFGVAENSFLRQPAAKPIGSPIHIVATGNDVTRDFDTVLAAFGNDPRFRLTMLTRQVTQAEASRYSNVEIPAIGDMTDFKGWYLAADYVCIPLHENKYSGITVALEAAAIGAPIVCSHTGGVPTYFDEREVLYVGVGDPEDLRARILGQTATDRFEMSQRANMRFRRSDYTTRGMMRQYDLKTRALLGRKQEQAAGLENRPAA